MFEIDHLCIPSTQMEKSLESLVENYQSTSETDVIYVDNLKSLNSMINELKIFNEIGVDVEHHDYRSYLGITCLIQISTIKKDYIIDPFPLWKDGHLTILNEIFGMY